jgi:antitoxin FitA
MAKMIQVRDVPDPLHRELTRRARQARLTLTAYVQRILEREIAHPPAAEVFERIAAREPVDLGVSAADLLRAERAQRKIR